MSIAIKYSYLEVQELAQGARSHKNILLIDARTPEEYSAGHVPKAINIPLDDLGTYFMKNPEQKNKKIVSMCGSTGRGERAADTLLSMELADVNVLRGGLKAWKKAGYPVE